MRQTATLDRGIYSDAAIGAAMSAFDGLAAIRIRETAGDWEVAIESRNGDDDRALARHFLTYALAASLEERLA